MSNIINKAITISNIYYNKALENARTNHLSEAVCSLNNALDYNKKHLEARTLLAIIYFENGLVIDCIHQLKIAEKFNPNSDLIKSYLNIISNNTDEVDKLLEANSLYNEALQLLKQDNDDIAIIKLKKAISINPKFLEANNLLALAYIRTKCNNLAIPTVNKITQLDVYNKKALDYKEFLKINDLKNILNTKKTPVIVEDIDKPKVPNVNSINTVSKIRSVSFILPNFVFLIGGMLISTLIFYIVINPSIVAQALNKQKDLNAQITTLQTKNDELEKENSQKINELQSKTDELLNEKKALEEKVSLQDKAQALNETSNLINSGSYEEASVLLNSITKDGLPEDLIAKYDELIAKSHPKTANILYQRGITKYRSKNYEEAQVIFKDCLKFAAEGTSQYGDSLYYLGEIALKNDDTKTAEQYFRTVVDEYKNIAKNYWTAFNHVK